MKSKEQIENEIKEIEIKLFNLKTELRQISEMNILYGPDKNLQHAWVLGQEHGLSYSLMIPSSIKAYEKNFEKFSSVNLSKKAAENIIHALQKWVNEFD